MLDGVSEAARQLPGLQLWCCFAAAPLLADVQTRIDTEMPCCAAECTCWDAFRTTRIEKLMRASDLFVLGSHREGSGYSLIEALACGLPPVVTDIPSFRIADRSGSRRDGYGPVAMRTVFFRSAGGDQSTAAKRVAAGNARSFRSGNFLRGGRPQVCSRLRGCRAADAVTFIGSAVRSAAELEIASSRSNTGSRSVGGHPLT